ncbi:hypothetical protein H4219_002868, partial [Mycoemilia scoparia]
MSLKGFSDIVALGNYNNRTEAGSMMVKLAQDLLPLMTAYQIDLNRLHEIYSANYASVICLRDDASKTLSVKLRDEIKPEVLLPDHIVMGGIVRSLARYCEEHRKEMDYAGYYNEFKRLLPSYKLEDENVTPKK